MGRSARRTRREPSESRHFGGYGVGVGVPRYLASITARASRSDFPAFRISITSRVISVQTVQLAAWLVNVIVPLRLNDLT